MSVSLEEEKVYVYYVDEIRRYLPQSAQETTDQKQILAFIEKHPNSVLLRENRTAHITSSGFIINTTCDKALLIHHNQRGVWAWTGGHADGDTNLLDVALREAKEETGVVHIRPLKKEIASLDILPVYGHTRKGEYVSTHLHLSVSYLLVCEESDALSVCEGENTAVAWFPFSYFSQENFIAPDVYLYNKLIERAKVAFGR